jgi:hypothetical protein
MDLAHSTKLHIRFIMRLILIEIICLVTIAACSTTGGFDPNNIEIKAPGPKSKSFYGSFANVWKAALITVGKYPLKSYDEDAGVIETDFIRGETVWLPPYKDHYVTGGYRYKINIRLIKAHYGGQNVVQAVVLKQPEIQKDFFTNSEKAVSDGLEEMAILYRIERELAIEQALKKIKTSR